MDANLADLSDIGSPVAAAIDVQNPTFVGLGRPAQLCSLVKELGCETNRQRNRSATPVSDRGRTKLCVLHLDSNKKGIEPK